MLLLSVNFVVAYPTKSIRVISPVSPGSASDVVARKFLYYLEIELNTKIYVENKPGAGSVIGINNVLESPSDGYTLLYGASAMIATQFLNNNAKYNFTEDFIPITLSPKFPFKFVSHKKFKDEQDFLNQARQNNYTYGIVGIGTLGHLSTLNYIKTNNINAQSIPYKGSNEVVADLLKKQIDFYLAPIQNVKELIETEKLFLISNNPIYIWNGLFVPKQTPVEIIEKLHIASNKVLNNKEFIDWTNSLAGNIEVNNVNNLISQIKRETVFYKNIIKEQDIKN